MPPSRRPKGTAAAPAAIAEQQAAERAAFLARRPVSRETAEKLDRYVALLIAWQARINLVSPATLPTIWTRHVADSAHLFDVAPKIERWVDLGSGGGLPGIVLGIMNGEGGHVDLIESNAKKAAFLRTALRETGVSGTVHARRIEECSSVIAGAKAVSARALAPLGDLFGLVAPSLQPGVACFFQKGRNHEQEVADASAHWRFTMVKHASSIEDGSAVLEIRDIEPLRRP